MRGVGCIRKCDLNHFCVWLSLWRLQEIRGQRAWWEMSIVCFWLWSSCGLNVCVCACVSCICLSLCECVAMLLLILHVGSAGKWIAFVFQDVVQAETDVTCLCCSVSRLSSPLCVVGFPCVCVCVCSHVLPSTEIRWKRRALRLIHSSWSREFIPHFPFLTPVFPWRSPSVSLLLYSPSLWACDPLSPPTFLCLPPKSHLRTARWENTSMEDGGGETEWWMTKSSRAEHGRTTARRGSDGLALRMTEQGRGVKWRGEGT